MYQQQRVQAIIEWLREVGQLTTKEIMAKFNTSRETARRDMMAVVQLGQAQRTHGGIVQTQKVLPVLDYLERQHQFPAAKKAMAAAVLPLIQPGMTVFLDTSTSVRAVAQQLHQAVTVFTTSLDNAFTLSTKPDVDLHLLGGRFEQKNRVFFAPANLQALQYLEFDLAIMGAASLEEKGAYVKDENDAALKRAAVAHARQVVILAENQKFQKKTPYLVAAWPDVDVLITDQTPTKEEQLPDNVEVMVAPPKD